MRPRSRSARVWVSTTAGPAAHAQSGPSPQTRRIQPPIPGGFLGLRAGRRLRGRGALRHQLPAQVSAEPGRRRRLWNGRPAWSVRGRSTAETRWHHVTAVCGTPQLALVQLAWGRLRDCTTSPRTSRRKTPATTSCSMRSARARSAPASRSSNRAAWTFRPQLGPRAENRYLPRLRRCAGGSGSGFRCRWISRAASGRLFGELVEKGKFRPVIDAAIASKKFATPSLTSPAGGRLGTWILTM